MKNNDTILISRDHGKTWDEFVVVDAEIRLLPKIVRRGYPPVLAEPLHFRNASVLAQLEAGATVDVNFCFWAMQARLPS